MIISYFGAFSLGNYEMKFREGSSNFIFFFKYVIVLDLRIVCCSDADTGDVTPVPYPSFVFL